MKKIIIFLFVFIHSSSFSTEQIPDLLIIDKDTIYLKSFPLDELNFKILPYGTPPNTACWRGYQAIWFIKDKKLFLKDIFSCSSSIDSSINIKEYFIANGYQPIIEDGYIYANWFSGKFVEYFRDLSGINIYKPVPNDVDYSDIVLSFIKGYLIINQLKI
jgi:hypothetical protein